MLILLFNGPPGSGKDTAASICELFFRRNSIKVRGFKFAHVLKAGVHTSLGLTVPVDAYEGAKKDKVSDDFFGYTPRQAYIKHSEEYMKKVYGEDVFAEILAKTLEHHAKQGLQVALISDCGFDVEVNKISIRFKYNQCRLFRINRLGCTFKNDSRSYLYPQMMQSAEIYNDHTLTALELTLQKICVDFMRLRNAKVLTF